MKRGKPPLGSAVGRAEASQAWRDLAHHARIHGEWVGRGAAIEKFAASHLVRLVSQAARVPFPLHHVSAQAASKAFLLVAQAFVTAVRDEDRRALGLFVVAGARCIDTILTEHAHRAADVWKRNLPSEEL